MMAAIDRLRLVGLFQIPGAIFAELCCWTAAPLGELELDR